MALLLFACVLATAAGSAVAEHGSATDLNTASKFVEVIRTGDSVIYYTPAVFYFTEYYGELNLMRCLVEDPNNCEVFHEKWPGTCILVHMEYVYVGKNEGITICESYRKNSCRYIYNTNSSVYSLTVGGEHLYAGLKDGSILVCNLQQPYSCRKLHTFKNRRIWSLKAVEKFIYVGLEKGLMRCSLREENSCTEISKTAHDVHCLTNIGKTIYATSWNLLWWNCTQSFDSSSYSCWSVTSKVNCRARAYFNGVIYVVKQMDSILICNSAMDPICRTYAPHKTLNIGFAYGTYHMQSNYQNENAACSRQPDLLCPPNVTYYGVQQRKKLEVHVTDGRLYDAAGFLIDTTSKAKDNELSGPAIFVMGPDGRILLKNSDDLQSVFTSSLFAGSPVSGAGEMVVEQGVIKKIAACSRHYLPDLKLNKQVVDSLRSQGYTEPIVSENCYDGGNRPKPREEMGKSVVGVIFNLEFEVKEIKRELNENKNQVAELIKIVKALPTSQYGDNANQKCLVWDAPYKSQSNFAKTVTLGESGPQGLQHIGGTEQQTATYFPTAEAQDQDQTYTD